MTCLRLAALALVLLTCQAEMAGSVIVVTGANKGIGLNIVTRFAHAAAEALAPPLPTVRFRAVCRADAADLDELWLGDAARGEAAVEQLRANGGDPASVVKFKQLDISDEESRKRFVADVQEVSYVCAKNGSRDFGKG
eukprot:scaffold1005_cov403-Pinguiococcus_pyrenoidosus.AAC.4